MNNPETQATLGTLEKTKWTINNPETQATLGTLEKTKWTIQRHRQHWAQEIEQRQTKQKTKKLGMNPGSCEW
jgi:hypothetical protein